MFPKVYISTNEPFDNSGVFRPLGGAGVSLWDWRTMESSLVDTLQFVWCMMQHVWRCSSKCCCCDTLVPDSHIMTPPLLLVAKLPENGKKENQRDAVCHRDDRSVCLFFYPTQSRPVSTCVMTRLSLETPWRTSRRPAASGLRVARRRRPPRRRPSWHLRGRTRTPNSGTTHSSWILFLIYEKHFRYHPRPI